MFDPVADWPRLPPLAGMLDVDLLAKDAVARIKADLATALEFHSIQRSLAPARVAVLAQELVSCTIAADCWRARTLSPRQQRPESLWQRFMTERLGAVRDHLLCALTRSAVLECIPVKWIPERAVKAQLAAAMRPLGYEPEVVELSLVPPNPGGSEWLRRDCARTSRPAADLVIRSPTAAILYWPGRVTPVVVDRTEGGLRAFGGMFAVEGLAFAPEELLEAHIVIPETPPRSWGSSLGSFLGLSQILRAWTRRRRRREGVSPFATS